VIHAKEIRRQRQDICAARREAERVVAEMSRVLLAIMHERLAEFETTALARVDARRATTVHEARQAIAASFGRTLNHADWSDALERASATHPARER
jgi:hypothetical protein